MDGPQSGAPAGQRDVHGGAAANRFALAGGERLVHLGQPALHLLLEPVDPFAVGAALRRLDALDAVERGAHEALLAADPADAQLLPRAAAGNAGRLALEALAQLVDLRGARDARNVRGRRSAPALRHQASAGAGATLGEELLPAACSSACFAVSAIAANPAASWTAMSARTLRSRLEPAALRPAIRRL